MTDELVIEAAYEEALRGMFQMAFTNFAADEALQVCVDRFIDGHRKLAQVRVALLDTLYAEDKGRLKA